MTTSTPRISICARLGAFVLGVLLLPGCRSDAETTVKKYFERSVAGDYDEAYALLSAGDQEVVTAPDFATKHIFSGPRGMTEVLDSWIHDSGSGDTVVIALAIETPNLKRWRRDLATPSVFINPLDAYQMSTSIRSKYGDRFVPNIADTIYIKAIRQDGKWMAHPGLKGVMRYKDIRPLVAAGHIEQALHIADSLGGVHPAFDAIAERLRHTVELRPAIGLSSRIDAQPTRDYLGRQTGYSYHLKGSLRNHTGKALRNIRFVVSLTNRLGKEVYRISTYPFGGFSLYDSDSADRFSEMGYRMPSENPSTLPNGYTRSFSVPLPGIFGSAAGTADPQNRSRYRVDIVGFDIGS